MVSKRGAQVEIRGCCQWPVLHLAPFYLAVLCKFDEVYSFTVFVDLFICFYLCLCFRQFPCV